jgi:hypothetical protein
MIAVGVDTHKEQHLAVALDDLGQLLAEITITTNLAGYRELARRPRRASAGRHRGRRQLRGRTGEYLQAEGIEVFEVERAKLADRLTGMRTRPTASLQENTTLQVLRDIANRTRALDTQANSYTRQIEEFVRSMAPTLLDEPGVGPICAGKLLAFNPARFTSEAAFAHANGTAPQPASSGKAIRHRLSRGGDRQTQRSTQSHSPAQSTTPQATPTCNAASPKERPNERPCDHSRDTSPATSTTSSPKRP